MKKNFIVDDYLVEEDIIDVLQRLRSSLSNGKIRDIEVKSENIVVTCPVHDGGRESKPACNIYIGNGPLEYGHFRCFVCDARGSFLKFMCEAMDASPKVAKAWLISHVKGHFIEKKKLFADSIDASKKASSKPVRKRLDPSILDKYQDWCPYLMSRKLSRETCKKFNVKYDPVTKYVVFPCYDMAGNLVMTPRRSTLFKKFYIDKDVEKPMYCLNEIVSSGITSAIVTEGLIDTLTSWEYGMPACGTLGTPSDEQIADLNKAGLRVVYTMFDNDEAGRKFAQTIKSKLNKNIIVIDVKIPNGKKDINDLSRDEFKSIISQYTDLLK